MCITFNVYTDLYIVQHHRILLYKYGAIEINKHLHKHSHHAFYSEYTDVLPN